jgi:hypothetical protein
LPTINLAKCGQTNPTNPIGPLMATAAAVINDAMSSAIHRRRLIRTPSESASPSLSIAMFSWPAR